MKKLLLLVLASCGMLMSCGGDDDEPGAVSEGNTTLTYFGYAVGRIGSKDISVFNTPSLRQIGGAQWQCDDNNIMGAYWRVGFDERKEGPLELLIYLCAPHVGIYDMKKRAIEAYNDGTFASGIEVSIAPANAQIAPVYLPDASRGSCRIHIKEVWMDKISPWAYVEGEIGGILYNPENERDSLVIKNLKFGLH